MIKRFFFLVFVIILSNNVFGFSLNTPEQLVANTNWNLTLRLDPTDQFSKTELLVDEKLVLTVFNNSQIVKDPQNGSFVINASVFDEAPGTFAGLKLFASFIGLSEGEHSINARSFNGDTLLFEETKQILVFNPLGSQDREEIDASVSGIVSQISLNNEKISGFESQLIDISNQLTQLNDSLGSRISEIDKTSEVSELQEKSTELIELVEELKKINSQQSALLETKMDKPKELEFSLGTGLFSLGKGYRFIVVFFIGLVFIAMGFFRLKKAGIGFGLPGGMNYTIRDSAKEEKAINEVVEESQSFGKWGTEPRDKKQKKGFFFGDIIKKK